MSEREKRGRLPEADAADDEREKISSGMLVMISFVKGLRKRMDGVKSGEKRSGEKNQGGETYDIYLPVSLK